MRQSCLYSFIAFLLCVATVQAQEEDQVEYGVDVVSHFCCHATAFIAKQSSRTCVVGFSLFILLIRQSLIPYFVLFQQHQHQQLQSYPMHHAKVSTNYAWLPHNVDPANNPVPDAYKDMAVQPLGNRQSEIDDFMKGCMDYYENKGKRCMSNEEERVTMSLRQPKGMYNYTQTGFTKIRAPEAVFKLIKEFWEKNKHRESEESWGSGNIYVNHWEEPTSIVSVEDTSLEGGGFVLKQHIWNAARDTISAWTGQQLAECSLYGIRVYKEGAILATHVDRLPLVSSAIINVDQDVDEPWPLEVIGHDGKAHNVTMVPGDMVLYESHSVLHGRPFPLKGRFMANVFM